MCQPLRCPRPLRVRNGRYLPCNHMPHTNTYGTFYNPLEAFCVKLQCSGYYLSSHQFDGKGYRRRWESDWKIPISGIVCSDGRWIGFVGDTCELTSRLTMVEEFWNIKRGLFQRWENGRWKFPRPRVITPENTELVSFINCRCHF